MKNYRVIDNNKKNQMDQLQKKEKIMVQMKHQVEINQIWKQKFKNQVQNQKVQKLELNLFYLEIECKKLINLNKLNK